jgi:hypothetical protein
MCHTCQIFLYDFLQAGLSKDHKLKNQIRTKSFQKTLPEFVDWCSRMNNRIGQQKFHEALEIANRIARRGRSDIEYEFLIQTATFNFLKCSLPWITDELNYMKLLLVEAGCIRGKKYQQVLLTAQEYISFMLPRVILCLINIHDDHVNPKGLMTDVTTLGKFKPMQQDDKDTLYDRDDDYQKAILEEDTDDLYT